MDVQVFHPRSHYVQGRPRWMRMEGYRRDVPVKASWKSPQVRLLEAFLVSESVLRIAMDRIIVRPGQDPPCLLLPRGRYRVVAQDEAGASAPLGEIEVR